MSKKCMVNRNKKREAIVSKFSKKRDLLNAEIKKNKNNPEEVFNLMQKIALLPRSSSATRVSNRCFITGRSRGVYRRFDLCRNEIRRLASFSDITGIKKSSW